MNILLTAGPTREPLDPVRYLGNRSSGRMGAAIAQAALSQGHTLTAILGPLSYDFPQANRRIDIETAQQMHDAVMKEWPEHDLLIMAAAVADYRPKTVSPTKMSRAAGPLVLELEPTPDIAAAACTARRPHQRVVGFSLEREGDEQRAVTKLHRKGLDLIVFNPLSTMQSDGVTATLIYPDGRQVQLPHRPKDEFAGTLLQHALALFR